MDVSKKILGAFNTPRIKNRMLINGKVKQRQNVVGTPYLAVPPLVTVANKTKKSINENVDSPI